MPYANCFYKKIKKTETAHCSLSNFFYKGGAVSSILSRLDDKLGRIMANADETPRINDVADIIGYCAVLLIGMGATAELTLRNFYPLWKNAGTGGHTGYLMPNTLECPKVAVASLLSDILMT